MTARLVFEATLIELNKLLAPSLLLEDFNYLFNKAINLYINKRYNIYDVNQQTTDDVRVLRGTVTIFAEEKDTSRDVTSFDAYVNNAIYSFNLPQDYLHLLNCTCIYKVNKTFKCYDKGTYWGVGAIRLTSDLAPVILNNYYMRPSYKKPYYYINNENVIREWGESELTPLNPAQFSDTPSKETSYLESGLDLAGKTSIVYQNSNLNAPHVPSLNADGKIKLSNVNLPRVRKEKNGTDIQPDDVVERTAGHRYGNASLVRLEIRYGRDNSVFELAAVLIDYIKAPQHIRLTQEQIDLTEDTSQIMEFPDYVCLEIINELVIIIMENSSDPKLQTFPTVTTSIASPTQGLTQTKK